MRTAGRRKVQQRHRITKGAVLIAVFALLMAPMMSVQAAIEVSADPTSDTSVTQEPRNETDPSATVPVEKAPDQKPEKTSTQRAAAAEPTAQIGITKRNNLDGAPLLAGGDFVYEFTVECSSLVTDCVGESFTDVLPDGLDVTSLPQSTSTRTVTYDETSRKLTVVFKQQLQDPVGETGLTAGGTVNLQVGMRLPADTPLLDGTEISNTAEVTAENADPKSDKNVLTISVPRDVKPIATKTWSDGSAVAGSGEKSTVTLGVRNGSSSSAEVTELSVTDETAKTFENFNLTDVKFDRFPDGADRAQLYVQTTGGWVAGAVGSTPGALALPAGVSAADVTAVRVVFSAKDGAVLPYDPTGGKVVLGMELRDTTRSDGTPLRPHDRLSVDNCAAPAASDEKLGDVTGADACRSYDILPDTLVLGSSKSFFADTNGNFGRDNGEYAVIGEDSPVSAKVDVQNKSPFKIAELVIDEPHATSTKAEFDKVDTDKVRLRFPSGATHATLVVTYADGTTATTQHNAGSTVDIVKAGTRVESIRVTYTGKDADGNATIAENAIAGLDVHGRLNDLVTASDLPDGTSPQVVNCAATSGSAGRTDSTGTAAGTACAELTVEEPRKDTDGVKTVGQTSVPEGQPIPFRLSVTNNGNLPLVDPVISDPRTGADDKPDPAYPNPFDSLRITSASVSGSNVTIQLFDPASQTWVAYDAADTALLERAKGVRAALNGELAPTKAFTLDVVTQRRDGVEDGIEILNCFSTVADGYVANDPACAPGITTGPVDDAASINKSISPSQLPAYVPGLPRQYATVKLTATNHGNLSMSSLRLTDRDADFFDAVDFVDFGTLTMPAGADRVQIDAYVDGAWVNGIPALGAGLPLGVPAADVVGVRVTFSNSNGGYALTPCAKASECGGALEFRVSPRQHLRSDSAQAVPEKMENTVAGDYTTSIQDPNSPQTVDPVHATLELTDGTASLAVKKTPDSTIAPGETAPFRLQVTNTGTSNITDLVVKDALPAGLQFDESYVGDGGQPFRVIDTKVPDGTPAVPVPVLDLKRDGDRVSGLSFDFGGDDEKPWVFAPGATLTIEIQVLLEPGVVAGEQIVNTMGATGDGPDLTCDDTSSTDDMFGEGTYCTDTAAVTTRAGAAFQARKWVAGNVDRGWYNTRTHKAVAVGDASCPTTTVAGVQYTAHPCIALVDPGDQYKYLLRLVNAGTESATDMRIIDRLPIQGDRGVHVDQDRGTEWNNRPSMATEPQLIGPGVLTTSYTNDTALCTDDLEMGGAGSNAAQCSANDWDDAFGPDVVATQMQIAFGQPLEPGKGVDITFAMNTPLDVEQVSDPTIAWNSFAHAETTLRSGKPHVLPPTEPIKVGVATSYGALKLVKKIGANPSNLPLAGHAFDMHVVCTIDPIGGAKKTVHDKTYQVSANAPVEVPGLPAGTDCQVWETNAQGGVSDHPDSDPLKVTIEPGLGTASVQTAEITNDFSDAELAIDKTVTGAAAEYAADEFDVDVFCTFAGVPVTGFSPKAVTVKPGVDDGRLVTSVPAGADCYAVESDNGSATEVTYDPAGPSDDRSGVVKTQSGKTAVVGIVNEFRAGGLAIAKELAGPGAPTLSDGPFTFAVACSFDGKDDVFTDTVTLTGNGTDTLLRSDAIEGLPVGALCTVTETDSGGADETPAPVTVTIPDEADGTAQVVLAGLTNVFSAGTVSLTKELEGAGADASYAKDATFTVQLTCERDVDDVRTTVYSGPVQIKGGETLTLEGSDGKPLALPLGTHCYGDETGTGGATSAVVDHDSFDDAVVVQKSDEVQKLSITATNTFDLGELELTKTVEGAAAHFAKDRSFTVDVTCVLPQDGDEPTVLLSGKKFEITDGQTVTVDDLPIGAQCWAGESDNGGATSTTISHNSASEPANVAADDTATIDVVNTFDAGELTVKKIVRGGGPGPYSFTLECTTEQGKVALDDEQAHFTLRANQKRTFEVPLGADCVVEEVDVAKGVKVLYTDTTGDDDGAVTVSPSADVTVTNVFPPGPDDGGDRGGLLPNTGGTAWWLLVAGLAALAAGGFMLRVRRR